MQKLLEKHSHRKNILILLALVIIIEILFGIFMPKGEGAIMIDMAGSVNSTQIYEIIKDYDAGMRQTFTIMALTLDLVFPLAYFLLFALLLFTYWEKAWLILLPLLQALFDLAENTGIVIMLSSWPKQLTTVADSVVIMSWLKWGFCAITIVLIIFGMLRRFLNKRKRS